MRRRDFMAASCLAGLAPLAAVNQVAGAGGPSGKELYELRLYSLDSAEKAAALDKFMAQAAIPALKRAGVGPVGVFAFAEEPENHDIYVLLPHKSMQSVVNLVNEMAADEQFLSQGEALLSAPKDDPAYTRFESSLFLAFDGVPKLETPAKGPERVFQLRTYESHSYEKALKKIEMFNTGGELDIFRRVGLTPVFFGQALIGSKLPNLTYMLGFDNLEAKEAGWKAFLAAPAWQTLKKDERFADTVSNITNLMLKPCPSSQI